VAFGWGLNMPTYADFVEVARVIAMQSHVTARKEVARELWRLAQDYQVKAAALDGGILPSIGDPPVRLASAMASTSEP
jgi:hypothetical protein